MPALVSFRQVTVNAIGIPIEHVARGVGINKRPQGSTFFSAAKTTSSGTSNDIIAGPTFMDEASQTQFFGY